MERGKRTALPEDAHPRVPYSKVIPIDLLCQVNTVAGQENQTSREAPNGLRSGLAHPVGHIGGELREILAEACR